MPIRVWWFDSAKDLESGEQMTQSSATPPSAWSVSELGSFFTSNRSQFLSHARRLVASSAEAEEIVQDALVKVLLACPELVTEDHARAYFHKIIENLSIDRLRKQGRQPRLVVLDEVTSEIESQWHDGLDHSEVLAAADDAALIREALALLSPAERAALVMWEFEGRSAAEIAKELGVMESTVKHTVARARAGLRRLLAERIIDQERGLTALDLLSVSYRKVEKVAQKSSKVALSLVLVLSAFLGFNSLMPSSFITDAVTEYVVSSATNSPETSSSKSERSAENQLPRTSETKNSPQVNRDKSAVSGWMTARSTDQLFLGLDEEGAPTGFTVTDSTGSLGQLFVGQPRTINTESGVLISNIASTKSGSANLLLDQSVILDAFGTSYVAEVSVGIDGGWQPLVLSYISSDIERLASGNYLLTAMLMVDSVVETSVKVPTRATGTDLSSAPEYLATRVLLDPTKTKILAQAVLVSADSQGDGA